VSGKEVGGGGESSGVRCVCRRVGGLVGGGGVQKNGTWYEEGYQRKRGEKKGVGNGKIREKGKGCIQ